MSKDHVDYLMRMQKKSAADIREGDLKNRFLYPFFPTIVIDNFYEDPDLIREFALDQEFFKGNRGSWPGLRTKLLHELDTNMFKFVSRKLMFTLREYGIRDYEEIQIGFQLIDESYGRGWVHDDDPKLHVAGVVYLNKDAGENCGTTIFEDAPDFNGEEYSEMFMKDVLLSTPEERAAMSKYREEQINYFNPTIKIESIYNRMVMFDSRCWHAADYFFGTDKESSRLNQIHFLRLR